MSESQEQQLMSASHEQQLMSASQEQSNDYPKPGQSN